MSKLKIVNWILLVLALVSVAFGLYSFNQYRTVPTDEYAARASELMDEAKAEDAKTAETQAELTAHQDALREDVSQGGTEGEALAVSLAEVTEENEEKTAEVESLTAEVARLDNIADETLAKRREYAAKIRELEEMVQNGETDVKICYWTFDDGPTRITSQVLDAAKELGVHVTFFTSNEANNSEDEPEMLRREFAEGHSVANHTYSHQFAAMGNLYQTTEGLLEMIEKQDEWVYECTGFHTEIFRFPGGSAWAKSLLGTDPTQAVIDAGYQWIEWSCDVFDNATAGKTSDEIQDLAVYEVSTMDIAVLLSHDWNYNTLVAFPTAVKQLQAKGYVFLPLFPESVTMGENTKIKFG